MPRWCALKVRVDCPDCGSPVLVDGPYRTVTCEACETHVPVSRVWPALIERALSEGSKGVRFRLCTLQQIGNDGLGNIYVGLNREHPPVCSECDTVIVDPEDGAAQSDFRCPACGALHPSWAAPGHLKSAGVLRVYMAPPEDEVRADPKGGAKGVHFACPNCGGNLRITTETKRICTCEYCDADTYLPASLWNQLHPVRRRRAFWLKCE